MQDISKAGKSILCQNFAQQLLLFSSNLKEISAKDDDASFCLSFPFLSFSFCKIPPLGKFFRRIFNVEKYVLRT